MRTYHKKGQVKAFRITSIGLSLSSLKWVIKGDGVYRKVVPSYVSEHKVSLGGYYVEDGSKSFCMDRDAFEMVYEPAFATGGIVQKPVIAPGVAIDTKEIVMPIITHGVLKTSVCEMCACKDELIASQKESIDILKILAAKGLPEDDSDCEAMSK